MPKPRALTPLQARQTIANRLGTRLAPRLRQLATNFGVRAYRVWLVWTRYDGEERGEGTEQVVKRVEVLPTPRVKDLDGIAYSSFGAGMIPEGSLFVDRVTVQLTFDQLHGRTYPDAQEENVPADVDFYYEVQEDGRSGVVEHRERYRLLGVPFRRPGKTDWSLRLQRASGDADRRGNPT